MAVERCIRCGRLVDLDWHVEQIIYIGTEAVCDNCVSDEEWEQHDNPDGPSLDEKILRYEAQHEDDERDEPRSYYDE